MSEDSYLGEVTASQTLNRYVYALNNPVMLIDISGFVSTEVVLADFKTGQGRPILKPFVAALIDGAATTEDPWKTQEFLLNIYGESFGELGTEMLIYGLRDTVNRNGFSYLGDMAFEVHNALSSDFVPFVGAAASFGFEYFDGENSDLHWMEKASRATFSASADLLGSAATLACGGNVACGIGVSAGLKTYGYGAVEWAGDIGGDILYNRFGIYNPEKTGGQAAAEITVGTGKSIYWIR